jgi:pimeloyl-ACP methyl ester carboxylesterase
VVAAGPAEFADQAFAAQLAQVISGLTGGVVLLSGHGADLGGQVGDGEPGRCRGQGQNRLKGSTDPRLVQVNAADADLAELGGTGQLIDCAVWDEGGVDAIQRGAERSAYFTSLVAPGKELVWFENSAHFPQWEERARFREFLLTTVLPATAV